MQTEGKIRQQLKQVQFRARKRLLKQRLRVVPCNCVHNRTLQLPNGHTDEAVSFCGLYAEDNKGEDWQGLTCDERYGGVELARDCPSFELRQNKAEVKAEFNRLLRGDRGVLASQHPDIAALAWVLDSKDILVDEDADEDVDEEIDEEPVTLQPAPDPDDSGHTPLDEPRRPLWRRFFRMP